MRPALALTPVNDELMSAVVDRIAATSSRIDTALVLIDFALASIEPAAEATAVTLELISEAKHPDLRVRAVKGLDSCQDRRLQIVGLVELDDRVGIAVDALARGGDSVGLRADGGRIHLCPVEQCEHHQKCEADDGD